MSMSVAAESMQGVFSGEDVVFTGVSIDTRTIEQGDLFIALRGPKFDGHNFLAQAISKGAIGAVLIKEVATALPYIKVNDTRIALGQLAAYWRIHFDIPVIGVTGSNGKTTVKEMIATILSCKAPCLATRGNLNNDIGVPLTLLRLRRKHRSAVIEMGMNHEGEIAYLSSLVRPDVGVITNASEAHLAGLGNVASVAAAKAELFSRLAENGTAVINADDPYCEFWRKQAKEKIVVTFGFSNQADVRGVYHPDVNGCRLIISTNKGEISMSLSVLGRHNAANALAATAASLAAGADLADIKIGLEKLRAVNGRLEVKRGVSGARIIDDTYNANPASLSVGLEVLKEAQGERILVLGDMAELGDLGPDIHKRVGRLAKKIGVSRLFALGDLTKHTVQAFARGAGHYASHQELVESLIDCLHSDATVLVKGSRSMHMENIVKGIVRRQED